MKVKLIFIGKNSEKYIADWIMVYEKRLKHYFPFTIMTVQGHKFSKSSGVNNKVKNTETKALLNIIKASDFLVLLDEKGKEFTSIEFSNQMKKFMNTINSNLVFITGDAYGFDKVIYDRANLKISLSKLTLPHQMARLLLIEQLYRAMTIIRNEPYHHE